MAYSDFKTLQMLKKEIGLSYQLQSLFPPPVQGLQPSEHLLFDLQEAKTYGLLSEKAKSEMLITPLLKEVRRKNSQSISFFSGVSLDTNIEKLNGICDYIFSYAPRVLELTTPIFCIVEAKNRTLEESFAQCAAEMYASYVFNEQNNEKQAIIYGAVTNAYEWAFLKYENNLIFIDEDRYALQNVEILLGVFQLIIDTYKK
jgi:hypothetical protein